SETPQIERIAIPPHELSALPKASQRLLDDSAFDLEAWLAARIADPFARAEARAFVIGDGQEKPMGFLAHPAVAEASWSWGNLGYVATGNDGDFATASASDAIVDLVYALAADYRANGAFVMNSKTAGAVRKMKDADGRFLWSDGLAAGEPARLMGYPVLLAEDMPDIASGSYAVAFGDFRAGYT
ncbi:phage major capsid protein, partial [Thioclava sp. BHET1]